MHDGVNAFEQAADQFPVANIALDKAIAASSHRHNTINVLPFSCGEIVEADDVASDCENASAQVRADKSGTSCD